MGCEPVTAEEVGQMAHCRAGGTLKELGWEGNGWNKSEDCKVASMHEK